MLVGYIIFTGIAVLAILCVLWVWKWLGDNG